MVTRRRKLRIGLSTVVILSLWSVAGLGQSAGPEVKPAETDRKVDANHLFVEAAKAYAKKDFAGAAEGYLRVLDAGTTWPTVPYNAACCLARLGRADEAFKHLEIAIQRGWSDIEQLKSDADLESIHSDKRWEKIVRLCAARRGESGDAAANPELYAELMKRMRTDQEARMVERPDASQLGRIDGDNTTWMKQVIEKHGWLGRTLVGSDGAQAAWLLVQHADNDPAFQRRCLDLLIRASEKGEASPDQVAYLTDRVRVAEGKPQVYGTQFHTVDGKLQPFPIENEAEVDRRREAMGLEPLAAYAEKMRSLAHP